MSRTRILATTVASVVVLATCQVLSTPSSQAGPPVTAHAGTQERTTAPRVGRAVVGGFVDLVKDGVSTHWAWGEYIESSTSADLRDPDRLVARVRATWKRPNGDTWRTVGLRREGGRSTRWYYSADAYYSSGHSHVDYGTWTITVDALDAEGAVLSSSDRVVESRDPMTAAHPTILSVRTARSQTFPRTCAKGSDGLRYCDIRVEMQVSDPDRIFSYAFISDKVAGAHETSNWYGAKVSRRGDVYTFRDSVPVVAKAGTHKLFVKRDFVTLVHNWPNTYARGVPAVYKWRFHYRA